MKKHKLNKSVMHDKAHFKKDDEISSDHPAFEALKSQGHVDELSFKDGDEAAPPESLSESGEGASEENGKKHGRRR